MQFHYIKKRNFIILLIIVCIKCCLLHPTVAQTPSRDSPWIRTSSFIVLPIAFYTPETRLGFGAAAAYTFRFRDEPDTLRPAQIQPGVAYTLENQLLLYLPFQIFYHHNQYNIYGELGYYRYFYRYYGIGNDTPTDAEELYTAHFPRVRLNVLRRLHPHVFVGLRYWFDDYRVVRRAAQGSLIQDTDTGSQGGVVSAWGVVANFDSRNNLFYPTRGMLAELVLLDNTRLLGSDFYYTRLSLDAAVYHTFPWQHTLALNGFTDLTFGDPPFFQMPLLGGTKKLRGHWEGRFRDRKLLLLQAEYRFPLFWRLGMVAFAGAGKVAPDLPTLMRAGTTVHYSVGGGLRGRLRRKDPIHIRIDVGFDENGQYLPYITIGEAF